MANTPFKTVINCATGERKEIPLSAEEIAEAEAMAAQAELDRLAEEQAQAEQEAARISAMGKLEALGLTPEEITALISA